MTVRAWDSMVLTALRVNGRRALEHSLTTSWTLIHHAAEGKQQASDEFARRYAPIIRAYLITRWRESSLISEIEDAIQAVFVECFKQGGVLSKVEQERPGGFRAFFYGVVRNVALKMDEHGARNPRLPGTSLSRLKGVEAAGESPSEVFDRAWARSLIKEAVFVHAARARTKGEAAVRRAEILRLRFKEGMPIREITRAWDMDSTFIHNQYMQARKEFKSVLMEILALEHPHARMETERILAELRDVLSQ